MAVKKKLIPPTLTIELVERAPALQFVYAESYMVIDVEGRVLEKRTEKLDAIPTSINSIIELDGVEDYRVLLPENLPNEFGSKDFEKLTKLHNINLHTALGNHISCNRRINAAGKKQRRRNQSRYRLFASKTYIFNQIF